MTTPSGRHTVRSKSRSTWQDQVRKACLTRVQQDREKLLDKCRGEKSLANVPLSSILADITNSQVPSYNSRTDVLVAHNNSQEKQVSGTDVHLLSGQEYEDLMHEMEAALFDEEAALEELQNIELAEIDEISDAFLAHCSMSESTHGHNAQVLCPVCNTGYLVESRPGFVICTHEQFEMEVPRIHGTASGTMRARIAHALEHHTNCPERPEFFVKNLGGVQTLFIGCFACSYLDVVN